MKMYTTLYKYAQLALPRWRSIHRNVNELMRTQWSTPEEIRELQLDKIKRLVAHAYDNVLFYRQRFQEAGIEPGDIKTLDDFRQIPVLSRDDIKRDLESFTAVNFPRDKLRRDATGGSTGEPLSFYRDIDWTYWDTAARLRVWSWFGLEQGCRQAWIVGRDFVIPSSLLKKIKTRLRREKWLNSFDMSQDKMQAFAETLVRFKPELIVGYNSSLWLFAQYLEKKGITGIRPRLILGAADKLYDFQRELIEKAFGCPVVDYYVSRENGLMAAQCPHGSMHWTAESHYLEIIANGAPVKPGEIGEVVITDLNNFGMPFIRYRNGDLARFEDRPCTCGRGLPVLHDLVGRRSDFFTTPEGKLISGLYFVHRLRGWPGVKKYRVHQPSVDKVEIMFEAEGDLDEDWVQSRRQEFQVHLGDSVQLCFKKVEHIALVPSGKYLFTTSAVPVNLRDKKQ